MIKHWTCVAYKEYTTVELLWWWTGVVLMDVLKLVTMQSGAEEFNR